MRICRSFPKITLTCLRPGHLHMYLLKVPLAKCALDVFAFNSSIVISRRRFDMANSARRRSLSARISIIDNGVDASSCFVVNRTARLCTGGMNNRPSKVATKNPIPKYMIASIMMPHGNSKSASSLQTAASSATCSLASSGGS